MIKLTASLEKWLWDNHRDKIALILLGHTEEFTEVMQKQYEKWLHTEEGKSYLKGGANYHDPR